MDDAEKKAERAAYAREYRRKNKEKLRAYYDQPQIKEKKARQRREKRAASEDVRIVERARCKAYRQSDHGKSVKLRLNAQYRERNRERLREKSRFNRQENVEKIRQSSKESARKKRLDPVFRLRENMRTRIGHGVRKVAKGAKSSRTVDLIGCSYAKLVKHLESLFCDGMSWENYGIGGWEIDHIIPCAAFNLSLDAEQKKCFHWSNLRPAWASDNRSKRDRMPDGSLASKSFSNNVEGVRDGRPKA